MGSPPRAEPYPQHATPLVTRALLIRRSTLFLASRGVGHICQVTLVALLVTSLPAAEFARYGLMTSALALLAPLFTLNLQLAPARLAFDCRDPSERAALYGSTWLVASAATLVGSLALLAVLQVLEIRDPLTQGGLGLQLLVVAALLGLVSMQLAGTVMRVDGDARGVFANTAIFGVGLLAAFLAVTGSGGGGLREVALAYAAAAVTAGLAGLAMVRLRLRGARFDARQLRAALAYAWPTALHLLAVWGLASSGQWIGARALPLETLAPYVLANLLIGGVSTIPRALFEARLPEIGSAFARGELASGMRTISGTTLLAGAAVVAIYAAAAALLFGVGVELPPAYALPPGLLAAAGAANLLDALYLRGIQTLQALKQTGTQAAATIGAGLTTVLLSVLWVGAFGIGGLIAALVVGRALQAIASNAGAQRRLRQARQRGA